MKRSLVLISVFLALCACKTQQFTMHDAGCTVIRDTVMQHDSIYVHEFMQGDTVYVTKYRDRWRDKIVNRCDTMYIQPTIPPDKPIPRFYKDCTIGFWFLLLTLLGSIALRIMKAIYLRR